MSWMVVLVLAGGGARVSWAGETHVSAGGGLLPGGDAEVEYEGEEIDLSLETAVTLVARVVHDVSPSVRLGGEVLFVPSVEIEGTDDGTASSLVSPALRGESAQILSPTTALYWYGRLGYSFLSHPDEDQTAGGLALGAGAGLRFAMSSGIDGFAEIGYQWASHSLEVDGPDVGIDIAGFALTGGFTFDL